MNVPIEGPSAWTGTDMAQRDEWIRVLSPAEVADIERVVSVLRQSGVPREQLTRADVPFDALAPAIASWREALASGRGFLLVRGLPVERMTFEDAVAAYWAIGLHLGTPVPQNFQGERLTDIRDTGADPNDPSTRLYKTRAEQDFHTDGADVIGLLRARGGRDTRERPGALSRHGVPTGRHPVSQELGHSAQAHRIRGLGRAGA